MSMKNEIKKEDSLILLAKAIGLMTVQIASLEQRLTASEKEIELLANLLEKERII